MLAVQTRQKQPVATLSTHSGAQNVYLPLGPTMISQFVCSQVVSTVWTAQITWKLAYKASCTRHGRTGQEANVMGHGLVWFMKVGSCAAGAHAAAAVRGVRVGSSVGTVPGCRWWCHSQKPSLCPALSCLCYPCLGWGCLEGPTVPQCPAAARPRSFPLCDSCPARRIRWLCTRRYCMSGCAKRLGQFRRGRRMAGGLQGH